MSLFTRKPGSDPIAFSNVEPLGRVRGQLYARHAGREYVVLEGLMDSPDGWSEREGALLLTVPDVATEPGTGKQLTIGQRYRRALPVESGTYDKLVAAKRARTPTQARRPIDALDALPMLAARPPWMLAGVGDRAVSLKGTGAFVEGRGPIRGRAMLDFLEHRRNVALSVVDGRLLASAPKGHADADVCRLLELAGPLLIGYVTGKPLPCGLRHDKPVEADTILLGGIAACQAHASGELAL